MRLLACSLVVIAVATGVTAGAQSLSDIAKKQQEREKTTRKAGKIYTDKDLVESPSPAAVPNVPATGAPGPGANATPPVEEKGEAYWKGLLKNAQTRLERNRHQLAALEKQLSDVENVLIDRDDYGVRLLVEEQRTRVLPEVERLKREIEGGLKEIDRIREDARRQGVPPGWLR